MSVLERVRAQVAEMPEAVSSERSSEVRRRLKHDLVDRLGLPAVAAMASAESMDRARSELGVTCQAILNTHDYDEVAPSERAGLVREVLDEVVGLGPLQPLLDDESVTEVMVNGCASLYYERAGTLVRADRLFDSSEQILTVVDRILAPLGRRLDESSPIVNARLANGYRVNAVISPVALDGPIVTIRKFSGRITSLSRLVGMGSIPAWYAQLLTWAVRARLDVAVAGGTGSGKTTLLNALSCEIGHGERIVTVEDSAELKFETHPHVVRLEARAASIEGKGEVTIRDLVTNALRMRPDRIVVGEVRGPECIDMLQAMNTGHDGSLTTLHAGTADEAILRLVLMARFGMDLPTDIIEEQIATALDLVVMGRRMPDGSRVVSEAALVRRAAAGGVDLDEVVSFDAVERSWHLVSEPAFVGDLVVQGIASSEEVAAWRSSCS
ncbi:MAG: CpaF family protein [Atopobiaceae bacterium]|jgi:pilus assembly protein CpaF|nr:CpaF family protein [Atopobiaceae bacterium]MCH4180170.1 CpaF family protein [Atopobiaceae bacterium]MCH4214340.1 CpaF family protein [Atopobiaceae bacterium]MCH4229229.1 CpaF family protein [Atopobiaceae bacterium]MCH4276600.1 CpaF family protein [Atopobiaceae bacterium]